MSWFFDNLFKRSKPKTDTGKPLNKENDEKNTSDSKFTSYDTAKSETSTPQKVREVNEPEAQHQRVKRSHGEPVEAVSREHHGKKKKKKK